MHDDITELRGTLTPTMLICFLSLSTLFLIHDMCSQTRTTHFSQNCTATIPFITQVHRFPGYQSWCLNVSGFDETYPFPSLKLNCVLKTSIRNNYLHSQKNKLKKASSGYVTSYNTANISVFKGIQSSCSSQLSRLCVSPSQVTDSNFWQQDLISASECVFTQHKVHVICKPASSLNAYYSSRRVCSHSHSSCHSRIFPLTAINNNFQLLPLNLFAAQYILLHLPHQRILHTLLYVHLLDTQSPRVCQLKKISF